MVQWEVVLICDRLSLVFVLSDDTASTECEGGADRFRAADDFVWCGWGALSANTVIHNVGDASVQGKCVLGGEVIAERGQSCCGALVERALEALNALGVLAGKG